MSQLKPNRAKCGGRHRGVNLCYMLMNHGSEKFSILLEYEMVMNIRRAANVNLMTGDEIIKIIAVGLVYLIISLSCGLGLFKKCDIK